MIRRFALLVAIALSFPAVAADRDFSITSFDRIRVEGPFDVSLSVGTAPRAKASGDSRAIDNLDIRVEGTTLIVRSALNDWAERGDHAASAPVITLATPMLRGATLIGGGKLIVSGAVKAQRFDAQLTGSGSLAIAGIAVDQFNATLLGSGDLALAGTAAKVRLITSGPGNIAAAPLIAGDLIVRLDGNGEIQANARYTAAVTSMSLGRVIVRGNAACTVKAMAGGPILCGKDAPSPGSN